MPKETSNQAADEEATPAVQMDSAHEPVAPAKPVPGTVTTVGSGGGEMYPGGSIVNAPDAGTNVNANIPGATEGPTVEDARKASAKDKAAAAKADKAE